MKLNYFKYYRSENLSTSLRVEILRWIFKTACGFIWHNTIVRRGRRIVIISIVSWS